MEQMKNETKIKNSYRSFPIKGDIIYEWTQSKAIKILNY